MRRVAVIDADSLIYAASASTETSIRWPNGIWTLHSDGPESIFKFEQALDRIIDKLKPDEVILALTHPVNFRKEVLSTYKGNRSEKRKPLAYPEVVQHCHENYQIRCWEGLEGDDVVGIVSGEINEHQEGAEAIMVSIDKDLKTIPGKLFNPDKPELGILEISVAEADRFHMLQTLMGDTTDGYSGCPGVGPKKAQEVLDEPFEWVKAGSKWQKQPTEDVWRAVVSHYEKAGLTEEDALVQARVARICRSTDFNWNRDEVILWTPH